MDDQVLRGLARWPNVPAVYGWLRLDRRGNWLLQGDPINNDTVTDYIARNYEADSEGRWFFQNGPQRVYVELEYTPFVYRALNASHEPLVLETHTRQRAASLAGAWIDENGVLLVNTERGIGLVHDRDLDLMLPSLIDASGKPLPEDRLDALMARVQQGGEPDPTPALWLKHGESSVKVEAVRSADVPGRFAFVARPDEGQSGVSV